MRNPEHNRLVLCLAHVCLFLISPVSKGQPAPQAGLILERNHAEQYLSGDTLEVEALIGGGDGLELTALGLYETPPSEWTLLSWEIDGGANPGVAPRVGASGVLEFAWITVPPLPVRLRYVMSIPEGSTGEQFFSGQVEYRLTSGGRQYSAPTTSSVYGGDNAPPVIALQGSTEMAFVVGTPYEEPGFEASDPEDGDLTAQVAVNGTVDVDTPGVYVLTYTVSDSKGLAARAATRTVSVSEDEPEAGRDPAAPAASAIGNGLAPAAGAQSAVKPAAPVGNMILPSSRPEDPPSLEVPGERFGPPELPGTAHRSEKTGEGDARLEDRAPDAAEGSGASHVLDPADARLQEGKAQSTDTKAGGVSVPLSVKLFFGFAVPCVLALAAGWYFVHRR
ncbi:MAG: DUF5011 domain-containing protein [Candidatus Hydrogenedentes bacterium]|nr:DUF5011 domain-containing protein [Candidatus Hydrogenedentota bacterium]